MLLENTTITTRQIASGGLGLSYIFETFVGCFFVASTVGFCSLTRRDSVKSTPVGAGGTAAATIAMAAFCADLIFVVMLFERGGSVPRRWDSLRRLSSSADATASVTPSVQTVANVTLALCVGAAVASASLAASIVNLNHARLDQLVSRRHRYGLVLLSAFNIELLRLLPWKPHSYDGLPTWRALAASLLAVVLVDIPQLVVQIYFVVLCSKGQVTSILPHEQLFTGLALACTTMSLVVRGWRKVALLLHALPPGERQHRCHSRAVTIEATTTATRASVDAEAQASPSSRRVARLGSKFLWRPYDTDAEAEATGYPAVKQARSFALQRARASRGSSHRKSETEEATGAAGGAVAAESNLCRI